LAEAQMRAFDRYAETVGKYVDIIQVNDDLGMQHATWTGPDTYRKLIKPYHAKLYRHIKDKCDAFLFLHSDGSLYPIIPDLIEIGVDILNPVQYTAADMDLAKLKREFGNDICFWGGGIDTQEALPSWEPEQVADQVRRNIDVLAPGGGFVFATVHNVVEGVPVENVLATFRTAAEHGRY
jgi:uroporphyrinogen decarboxylase